MSALVSATIQKRGMVKMDVETITPVHLGERVGGWCGSYHPEIIMEQGQVHGRNYYCRHVLADLLMIT